MMDIYGKEEDRAKWAMHYAQVKANIEQPLGILRNTQLGIKYIWTNIIQD